MNQVNFRKYSASDRNACKAAFKSNVPRFFTPGEVDDFEHFLTRLDDQANPDNPPYYVLIVGHEVIGCGGFGRKEESDAVTFVWGLIHHDYHKKGYGAQLLIFRLSEIKVQFPGTQVILDTTQFSYSFFEKYGFKTVNITQDFYAAGMHRYDMVLEH
ncbi:MAG TPA: GNAT family N-acetyltransferase [Chitinophagaceae bacterium]|nr:GNAT family N-acetyltransferase [Chitinophagaceae bacterium]